MLQRPIFQPYLQVQVVEGEGLFLLSEVRHTVLQGRLFEVVGRSLDGRPVEEICRSLKSQATPAQVFYTVNKLERGGFICEHDERVPSPHAALWALQGFAPADAAQRLATVTVAVHGIDVDTARLRSLLESMDVRLADDGDLSVVVTDQYLNRGLAAFNREALRTGKPWLLVKPIGAQVWIGPLFRPGKTACWECLAQRMRANYPVIGYLDSFLREQGSAYIDRIQTPATLEIAWGLAANTIATWVAGGGELPLVEGKIRTFDVVTMQSQSHQLLRHPACPECGPGRGAGPCEVRPIILESRHKIFKEDGGHRASAPQDTIAKYEHHVSPICGAVTILERWSPANDGVMHVYLSGNNIARGPRSLFNLKTDLRNSSCGKGTTELQAKASALCEGLERYCGSYRGDETRRPARMHELGEAAIHPNRSMLFSDKQYARRDELNRTSSIYNYIPMPFDEEAEVDWTPVWSLTRGAERYLPTASCYFHYPHDCRHDFSAACSNGNAAGNDIEEAVLQGFFELVERDAVALWWWNRVQMPGIDLASFDEPYLDRLQSYFKTCNRTLWALDLTTDLGIPVVAALSRREDDANQQIMFGFGAHLDPRIALLRAVTELNQMLIPLLNDASGQPPRPITDDDTLRWVQTATVEEQRYLVPKKGPQRTPSDYTQSWTEDLKEDLLICKSRVEQMGLEMLVLNQTRAEIGLPVVKVFVPGLRHFWMRFAPGRLYDVPVKLGWRESPCAEEDLNPFPMFL